MCVCVCVCVQVHAEDTLCFKIVFLTSPRLVGSGLTCSALLAGNTRTHVHSFLHVHSGAPSQSLMFAKQALNWLSCVSSPFDV